MSLSRRLGRDTLERDVNRLKSFTADFGGFTMTDPFITQTIQPELTNTHDIGTGSLYYQDCYFLQVHIGDNPAYYQGSIWGRGQGLTKPEIAFETAAPSVDAVGNNSRIQILAPAVAGSSDEDAWVDIRSGDNNATEYPFVQIGAGSKTWKFAEDSGLTIEGEVNVAEYLYHAGDADTFVRFEDDKISLAAGGVTFLELTEAAQDIIHVNSADADVDFQVDTTAGNGALFVEGSSGNVGVADLTPAAVFSVGATSQFQVNSTGHIGGVGAAAQNNAAIDLTGTLTGGGALQRGILMGNLTVTSSATTEITGLYVGVNTPDSVFTSDTAYGINIGGILKGASHTITRVAGLAIAANPTATHSTELLMGTVTIPDGDYAVYSSTTEDSYFAGDVGIKIAAPTAVLHVNQSGAAAAVPALHMEQDDVSEEFIRFTGTAAAGVITQSIVDEGDQASSTLEGWLKVYVVDEGNQITDQAYYVQLYTLSA
jgi:hypothetical protein